MDISRYPRQCLFRLAELAVSSRSSGKFNWYLNIRHFWKRGGLIDRLRFNDPELIVANTDLILRNYAKFLMARDLSSREKSRSSQIWPFLELKPGTQDYLLCRMELNIRRIFAQIRLSSIQNNYIRINKMFFNLKPLDSCLFCNTDSYDLH